MEFSLAWLADHVDLPFRLEQDAAGRHRFAVASGRGGELEEEEREKSSQIGNKLTAVGLAVEGMAERPLGSGAGAGAGGGAGSDVGAGGVDYVLDIDVTSNRPDCMCHIGVARELAVALGQPLMRPSTPLYGSSSSDGSTGSVILEDAEGCPRYVARVIRGVKVGPSPDWLRARLEAIGQRSINNVVDATNFVLWEMGQPLHAFDFATIPGGEIRVRRARPGELLTTLDGKERELDPEILVIADRERAVALAGVMGGLATEVTGATVDLLLESAHFERKRIRVGAKRLGLHTDASHRFERGADFAVCDEASRRCAALIVEVAGGSVEEPAVDAIARRPPAVAWRVEAAALERFVGMPFEDGEIERILAGLGFAPERGAGRVWTGAVPSFRAVDFEPRRGGDPARPTAYAQDLFEELLRHAGLDRVPSTLPALVGVDAGANPVHDLRGRAQSACAALGFAEGIHFAFHAAAADERFPALARSGPPLALANPLSERYAVLRRSLVPNLVEAAEANGRRGAAGVRLFEVGHLFPGGEGAEIEALAAVAGGSFGGPWDRHGELDLMGFKGLLEALFAQLGEAGWRAQPAELAGVLSGTGAEWRDASGELAGWFGRVADAETPFALFAGEVRLDRFPLQGPSRPVVAPPRVPGVAADLTLTHPESLSWSDLESAVRGFGVEHLAGFALKERYRGAGVPAGAVATTITFEYNAGERTLTQDEVNARQSALAAELERRFGVAREGER